jgi:hypothetical protein
MKVGIQSDDGAVLVLRLLENCGITFNGVANLADVDRIYTGLT